MTEITEISKKETAREMMRIWENRTDDNICDGIKGLVLDDNGDFLEPPSYTWDEQSDEVSPELELVKPKSRQLNLWIRCDDGVIRVIEIKYSAHGGLQPFSRVHDAPTTRGYISDIPEVAAADIIRSFMDFFLVVRERVENFNAARRRAYDTAAIDATIDKALVKFAAASSGPKPRRQATPRTRTPAIKSEEDIYSAVAPFFKADQQVMDAAEKAINTFNAIGSPYDSVDTVMQELGRALHGYRNANAGPAAKRTRL